MADEVQFKKGMALLAGGVTLITTGSGAMRRGITATAVCSLSAKPPSLIACANKDTGTAQAIKENNVFVVNVLGNNHKDIAMVFAGATGIAGVGRFEHGNWADHSMGVPYLEDALVSFVCETGVCVPYGSHFAFIGEVKDVIMKGDETLPVAWLGSSFHSLSPVA